MGDQDAKMRKEIKSAKAKHGLSKKNGIRAIGLSFLRDQIVERERGEEKREEEEEEEKKKRREEEEEKKKRREEEREKFKQGQKGMELHGILKFCMNFHA